MLVWLRRDLRLSDNPALAAAFETGQPIIAVYIYDTGPERRRLGGASRWWLDKSLRCLGADIESLGGRLILRRGRPEQMLDHLIRETGAKAVYWNRRYDAAERELDQRLKTALSDRGIAAESFNAALLVEPWALKTGAGGHYKVFSPFWRALQSGYTPPAPHAPPQMLAGTGLASDNLDDWGLHPKTPDWSTGFVQEWTPGEAGAKARLSAFLDKGLATYSELRNHPDRPNATSGLSPHLAFGEIGPAELWRAVKMRVEAGDASARQADKFLSELAWREFSYTLLFSYPALPTSNYKPDFNHMPWRPAPDALTAWQRGQTGYPIVDAGMRQLWQTGTMHNRVRMITASFLTKHLLIDWREGEAWFWDTLVDADPANNPASWQWVAGSGADAAPYFRIFNPITQGEKFDKTGAYVRRWCPELAALPDKFVHQPWTAAPDVLASAGITLGETYPRPIVDHRAARARALGAYETLKSSRDAA